MPAKSHASRAPARPWAAGGSPLPANTPYREKQSLQLSCPQLLGQLATHASDLHLTDHMTTETHSPAAGFRICNLEFYFRH